MSTPAFTPPTIDISATGVGGIHVARVTVNGKPYRSYLGNADSSAEHSIVTALETALHAEYAMLEQQRALVRELRRLWKKRKPMLQAVPHG